MNDDEWDERLSKAARSYHQPPETPKEEIWAGIRARRKQRSVLRPPRVIWWSVGVAALLVLAFGIGRLTVKTQAAPTAPELAARSPDPQTVAMAIVAIQHLSRAEALLTGFRAESRSGGSETSFSASARDLLSTTRLLLDSPELTDPQMRSLLEDLELVLAQITQLSAQPGHEEVDLITEGLKQRGLLPRLRSAIPAGSAATSAQGEI